MNKTVNKLKKKISGCKFFIVLGTKNYLKELRIEDSDILIQIKIARELKKPFFIIKDSRLTNDETEEIGKYFSKDNVVKEITVDIGSKLSVMIIASEIRNLMTCMYPGEDKTIDIVTPDDKY